MHFFLATVVFVYFCLKRHLNLDTLKKFLSKSNNCTLHHLRIWIMQQISCVCYEVFYLKNIFFNVC